MTGQLSNTQTDELLYNSSIGRIGCTDGNKVYVVPVSFVYDGQYIILHSRDGLKTGMMRQHPEICFEVDRIAGFNHWETVIIHGLFEELTDEEDKYYAMKKMVDHHMKLKASNPEKPPHLSYYRKHIDPVEAGRMIVYRIAITEKTGRFERE